MSRIPHTDHILLHLNLEIVLALFALLLESDFKDFCHLFQIWFPYQRREFVHQVLQNLDWSVMHKYDTPWLEDEYQRFSMFITECQNRGIRHALCYNSCKNVLLGNNVQYNLNTLLALSHTDTLSFLAYYTMLPVYNSALSDYCAGHLFHKFKTSVHFRDLIWKHCETLKGRNQRFRGGWTCTPPFVATEPFCSFYLTTGASSPEVNIYRSLPTLEELLRCDCPRKFQAILFFIVFISY